MSFQEDLGFNIINIREKHLEEKEMEVEFACAKQTILLTVSSLEMQVDTESHGVSPGTANQKQQAELWMRWSGGPGPKHEQLKLVATGRSPLQMVAAGELRKGVS